MLPIALVFASDFLLIQYMELLMFQDMKLSQYRMHETLSIALTRLGALTRLICTNDCSREYIVRNENTTNL